jgi:hypothetical protein
VLAIELRRRRAPALANPALANPALANPAPLDTNRRRIR